MKFQERKKMLHSLGRLLLLILLLFSAVAWRGQLLGIKTDGTTSESVELQLPASACIPFFYSTATVEPLDNNQFKLKDSSNHLLGFASGFKGAHGYGGRVPLFVFSTVEDTILGVALGQSYESKEHLNSILESSLLDAWNGVHRSQVKTKSVDMISGATLTSQAIVLGVQSAVSGSPIVSHSAYFTIENIVSIVLLLLLTCAYFFPKRVVRYRMLLLGATIIVFGFWLTRMLSLNQVLAWSSGGIHWEAQLVVGLSFILAILLPVVFGKSFYCTWVCPLGAAQEFCGKTNCKKITIPQKVSKQLSTVRELVFFSILMLLWTGVGFDVARIEPFAAFSFSQASKVTIGLAGSILLLSFFIPKAWCKYLCPLGTLFHFIRKV